MKKRFIEWDFPIYKVSEESEREKNVRHGYISTLHTWWARKPLSASIVSIYESLIPEPINEEERLEKKKILNQLARWENPINLDIINKARKDILSANSGIIPKVLDPFAGGGSIPLAAVELGCETHASDLNPVAVLIMKCTFEFPLKYSPKSLNSDNQILINQDNKLLLNLKKWSKWVEENAEKEIGRFYPKNKENLIPIAYYWMRTVECKNPSCNAEIPLTTNLWLARKSNKKTALKILTKNNKIFFEIKEDDSIDFNPDIGTVSRAKVSCPCCGLVLTDKELKDQFLSKKNGERLVAILYDNPNKVGKVYTVATEEDINIFREAEKYLNQKRDQLLKNTDIDPVPNEEMPKTMPGGIHPPNYGLIKFGDLFNSRQKLALITFTDTIKQAYKLMIKQGLENDLGKAVMSYLSIGISRLADFGSSLCSLNTTGGRGVVHTFGRPVIPMAWDYAESNPFYKKGAGWPTACEKNEKWIEHASLIPFTPTYIKQSSATNLDYENEFFDLVITDPPYYYSVTYSDLADFFYVWLKRLLYDVYPELFTTPLSPKTDEIIEGAFWDKIRYEKKDNIWFEQKITDAFKEIHRVLKNEGIAIIIFAHKSTEAWEAIINAILKSGFYLTSSWPLHTEMKVRLSARESAALASSIYMVCRKRIKNKVGFYSELQPLIKDRVEMKLQQFWEEGISGGDFFISAIGPGMEIFSQYERVEKLSGEILTTQEFLDYIRSVSTDFMVKKLLKDAASAKIDNESEFYLAYRWTYQDNTVEYDDARKLASASGVNLEELWAPGSFVKKTGSTITVLGPKERDHFDSVKSMVDVMHKSLLLWEIGKKEEIAELLTKTGYAENPAFKQFCQAVAESLLNGNKEKQLLEGFLIGIDGYKRGEVKVAKTQTDLKQYGVR